MSTPDILILAAVIVAFLAFGIVLAWGDYQTLDIARKSRERALSGTADTSGHAVHH
ncbi:MAG TPA: hypothetical protein VIJ04_16825 [Xanthobacteraceae bacterium]